MSSLRRLFSAMNSVPFWANSVCLVISCFLATSGNAQSRTTLATRGMEPILPPSPRIMRDIATVNRAGTDYTYPVIPAYKTSLDGRIAINPKTFGKKVWFNLLRPESIGNSLLDLPPGAQVLAYKKDSEQPTLEASQLHRSTRKEVTLVHATLCETSLHNPQSVERKAQPTEWEDVYEFQLIVGTIENDVKNLKSTARNKDQDQFRFWSTPITVSVENPKTAQAKISSIRAGKPIAGPYLPIANFFEPIVSSDGHLLFGRVGNALLEKTIGKDLQYSGRYNIVYSVAPATAAACDISQWNDLRPLAYAPYDSDMKGRYPIANYPFRDSLGNLIPKDSNIPASYPWIDRQARNVFLHVDNSTLYFKQNGTTYSRYEARCLSEVSSSDCLRDKDSIDGAPPSGEARGLSVLGLWTHGKLVTVDGILNHTDYELRIPARSQRELKLYRSDGKDIWVRMAAGRDNEVRLPAGVMNTTFIDSFENAFNMHQHMKPKTLRDVVWLMNRGNISDEVTFDDYQDLDVLIYSEMNAAWHHDGTIFNGFNDSSSDKGFTQGPRSSSIRLQNAATSPLLKLPDSGRVYGHARIEPGALGGIRGKGLFLHSQSRIEYEIPTGYDQKNWHFGLFLDRRPSDSALKTLFTTPTGAAVLMDDSTNEFVFYSTKHKVELGRLPIDRRFTGEKWNSFGFYFWNQGAAVTLFVDGMRQGSLQLNAAHYRLTGGKLIIGYNQALGSIAGNSTPSGARGWYDDIRLHLSSHLNYEEYCNYARGTLVGMDERTTANAKWWDLAETTDPWVHTTKISEELSKDASRTYNLYACFVDYTGDNRVSLQTIPTDTFSVRDDLLFPEGRLVFNKPRPDSTQNRFCLSCHRNSDKGVTTGLSRARSLLVEALSAGNEEFRFDLRRQPLDAPREIYGRVPSLWIEARDGVSRPLVERNFNSQFGNTTFWVHPE